MSEIYQIGKEELLTGIDLKNGLAGEEANEILKRDGENVLKESEKNMV